MRKQAPDKKFKTKTLAQGILILQFHTNNLIKPNLDTK